MKKQRCFDNFHSFILKILQEKLILSLTISSDALDILNQLIYFIINKYIDSSVQLCRFANKITIDGPCIITLTNIWLSRDHETLQQLQTVVENTWKKYSTNTTKNVKKHKRAGLCLPVSRIKDLFGKRCGAGQQIGEKTVVYVTTIVEELIEQLLIVTDDLITENKTNTITGRYLYEALASDKYKYQCLFNGVFISGLTF